MKAYCIAAGMLVLTTAVAGAATVTNNDNQDYMLVVTEGGERSEIGLGAGQTVTLCAGGCFLTLPNGDREALAGSETVEITNGRARIK